MATREDIENLATQFQNALREVNDRVEHLEINPAGAAQPIRFRLQYDTYSYEGTDPQSDFDNFEQNVRVVTAAMQYPFPAVCNAIIGQMRGTAAQMVRDLAGNYDQYHDLNEFLDRLRQIFVSPAYREKARAAFESRRQMKNETIIAFHGILRSLWEKSFPVEERQVATLTRQFISGLRNHKIVEKLIDQQPETYEAALQEAMRLEGNSEILNMIIRRQQGEDSGSLHQQFPSKSGVQSHQNQITNVPSNAPEPMEIGNISYHKQGSNYPHGRGKGRGFHQSQRGRNKNQSYKPHYKNGSYSHQVGSYNHQFNHQTYPQKDNAKSTSKDECLACGGKGHWAKECPTKRKQNKRGTFNHNKTRGFTRPNGQYRTVNHISEENHSDTDAKNGHPGMQHPQF